MLWPAFICFAKAFARFPHTLLVRRLEPYGLSGQTHATLSNFSMEQRFADTAGPCQSEPSSISTKVHYGSAVDHLLFLVYINDSFRIIPVNIVMHSDD